MTPKYFSDFGMDEGPTRSWDFIEFGPRKISEQYPVIDVSDAVAEVVQAKFGVTDAKDTKPIIATSALFMCIGLLGYDSNHHLGFLMHIQPSNDVRSGLERLYQELARKYPDGEKEFDTHIVASTFHDFQNYRDLEEALKGNSPHLGIQLKQEYTIKFRPDMKRDGKPGEGVALDTRNGSIFAYLRDTVREGPCDFRYNNMIPEKRSFGFNRFY